MDSVQLSEDARRRLADELAMLKGARREEVRQAILEARQMGSIVENGDYTAAKEEERLLEDRIARIEELLSSARTVADAPEGEVSVGRIVEISFEDGEQETFLYGESVEKGEHPVCTPTSPLGRSIVGKRSGDMATFRTPSGVTVDVRIVRVTKAGS